MSSGSESYARFSIVRLRFSSMDIDFRACSTSVTSCAELPATLKTKGRPEPPATTSFTPSPRLELPPIGWQLFILNSAQSDFKVVPSLLDTYSTHLLAEALSHAVGPVWGQTVTLC